MDFQQKIKKSENEQNYHIENLKITREFSKRLLKEMDQLVRSIVLFGSNANDTQNKNSDIDVMIILNNVTVFVTDELKEAYRIITNSLNQELANNKIHIMTVNLSDLWDMARKGDPVLVNVLRHGLPIFDRDLIDPLQYLLEIGRIRPTKESIHNYQTRANTLLEETNKHLQNALLDLYYSTVDIVHAALMSKLISPPSPKQMPELFKKTYKDTSLEKYSPMILEIYELSKKVEKNQIQMTGKDIDKYTKITTKLVSELNKSIDEEISQNDFEF
jgi:predicted nucleotidyltransferase